MRIGFEAKRLFLNDRGLGSYARNLLAGLVKYAPANEYLLYTPAMRTKLVPESLLKAPQVRVITPPGWLGRAGSYWRSFRLGRQAAADKVTVFHGLAQELPADISRAGVKSVVTVHDLIFLQYPEFYQPADRWIYLKKVKHAVSRADRVVAISQQTRQDLLETFHLPDERVSVIYQSCHEVFYEKRTEEELQAVREKWRLPGSYLLYVGALNENKNVLVILQAMHMLKGRLDLPLVVVGHGAAYKKKMQEYARKHGLESQLIWASEKADPTPVELSAFYQMAAAFVFPSFYEGFGIPILEARFSGTPVLASNSSCLHEAGGESTLYFDPRRAEELAQLLAGAAEKGATNLPAPDEFRQENLTGHWQQVYEELAG